MAIASPDTPEVQAQTEPNPKREYVVLAVMSEPDQWWQLPDSGWGINEQTAKEDAISKLPPDEQAGTFVGIPVRSWKPRTRVLETRTRPRWS